MKRTLLGTTALTLLAGCVYNPETGEITYWDEATATIKTEPVTPIWGLRIGGYMEQYAAYGDTDLKRGDFLAALTEVPTGAVTRDGDFDGIDSKQDTEIHFLPSITLDNGLQFGANIQLEGNTSGDQIDESYLFIQGSFGRILLGSENSAGYLMHYGAPDVTFLGVNSGSLTAFIPFSGEDVGSDVFRGTLGSTYLENARNNDVARFTYFTPRFAGFQLGLSYARDDAEDNNAQININEPGTIHDIFDIGANYVKAFGDLSVAVSGRYGWADMTDSSNNPEVWSAGVNLGYMGFTIGASYGEQNDTGELFMDGHGYDVGVSYETGPWGVSFTWFHGENENNEDLGRSDEELDQFLLGVNYKLAQGVSLGGFGAYVDFKEDDDGGGEPEELDGWVLGTGIKISF